MPYKSKAEHEREKWLTEEPKPVELPGGHCPHVSRPEALADALEGIEK